MRLRDVLAAAAGRTPSMGWSWPSDSASPVTMPDYVRGFDLDADEMRTWWASYLEAVHDERRWQGR